MPFSLLICLAGAASDAGLPGIKCDFGAFEGEWKSGRVLTVSKSGICIVDEQKAKLSYPFHLRLANGEYNRLTPDAYSYLPQDIRIGDVVMLVVPKIEKQEFCVSICLQRRLGGKIPPSRKQSDWRYSHEKTQAYNDYKDFGTPIPRFLSVGANYSEYPAFDLDIPKEKRVARFPHDNPFTYYEYLLFMR